MFVCQCYGLVSQSERDLQNDAVFVDFSIAHGDFLARNPRTHDPFKRFGCALDAILKGVIKRLGRRTDDRDNFCD